MSKCVAKYFLNHCVDHYQNVHHHKVTFVNVYLHIGTRMKARVLITTMSSTKPTLNSNQRRVVPKSRWDRNRLSLIAAVAGIPEKRRGESRRE